MLNLTLADLAATEKEIFLGWNWTCKISIGGQHATTVATELYAVLNYDIMMHSLFKY